MSTKIGNLKRRVGKVENSMAAKERQARLAGCNCVQPPAVTVLNRNKPAECEAEINKPCPVHGQRCLGQIIAVYSDYPHQRDRLDELLDEYKRRIAARGITYETDVV